MKNLFFITIILLLSCSCSNTNNMNNPFLNEIPEEGTIKAYPIKEGRFDLNENEYVTMQILPNKEADNSSHILRIDNHTEKVLHYGKEFSLEYLNGNNWESIPLDMLWENILLGLLPGEITEGQIGLVQLVEKYNNGKKGRYKWTKDFSLWVDFPFGDVVAAFYLSPEFEIK